MSSAEVVALPSSLARTASFIGQATAVEQARAVAEVQAAIVVAQQCPRDMERALGEMRDSCGRMALAQRAFYAVTNRGTGPSVHLARELARIWGNMQYGVHELRRDDEAGESEIQAFALDVQTNTRSTRTFVVPHARMKGKDRQKLTDLGDIYLANQNIGARAVRECIFSVLPTWFTEEAMDRCHATLEKGEGKPLEQRITEMIAAFGRIGVSVPQLEQKTTRKRGQWTASDVAQMAITYTSITRDGISKDEVFPPSHRVTASEIIGDQPAAPVTVPKMTAKQRGQMFGLLAQLGHGGKSDEERAARLQFIGDILGIDVETTSDLDDEQAAVLIEVLHQKVAASGDSDA